jgi:hypothetical protein
LEEFNFHEGTLPPGFLPDYEESLYNLQAFRFSHTGEGWRSYCVINKSHSKVQASIYFHIKDTVARSPLRAPFGSLEFSEALPFDVLFEFIKFFEQRLHAEGISAVIIKSYAHAYSPKQSALLETFFINSAYEVITAEINSSIDVTSDSADDTFHRSQKRRLDKSLKAGLVFKEIQLDQLLPIYTFIAECRKKKAYGLSMSYEDLKKIVSLFPDRYFLFGVFEDDQLAAAAITIRVKQNILYDFYHDHASLFDHLSPVTLLVSGIYGFCRRNKITLFDLGTSATEGLPNFGLLRFKTLLGATPTPKLTFEKIFIA